MPVVVSIMFKHRPIIHQRKQAFNYMTKKPEANRDNSACRFHRTAERRKVRGG